MTQKEIDTLKQEWYINALESYVNGNINTALSPESLEERKVEANKLNDSNFLLLLSKPVTGDDFLVIKLIDKIDMKHDVESHHVTINARRMSTLERNGTDINIYHESGARQIEAISIDLPVAELRPCSKKDADMVYKIFYKVENAVKTGISWLFEDEGKYRSSSDAPNEAGH